MFGQLDHNMMQAQSRVAPDQQTVALRYVPSAVEPAPLGPVTDIAQGGSTPQLPPLNTGAGGGGTTIAPMNCLTAAQVALLVNCGANPSPDCAALMANSGLPLCPGEKLPMPGCSDDQIAAGISYCDQYGPSGPDPAKNAVCWAAMKDPAWYAGMKSLPPCPGSQAEKKKKMLMWGGLLLGVAVVGGVGYWYATKKG